MKRFLFLSIRVLWSALFVITLFRPTLAHNGALSLYTDATLTTCSSSIRSFETDTIRLYYVRDKGPNLGNAVEFRLEASTADALFLGTEWSSQITVALGDILTGIFLTGSQCMGANEPVVYIGAIYVMYTGFAHPPNNSFTVTVKENPIAQPPGIYITECAPGDPLRDVLGGTFAFNGEGSCLPYTHPPSRPSGFSGNPLYNNQCDLTALFMSWNHNAETNISHYKIYKDANENFIPSPLNLLASPVDTFFYDDQWNWTPYVYYKISAVNDDGLESAFTSLRPEDVTEVNPDPPTDLTGAPWYHNNNFIALIISWNHNIEPTISHYNIYKNASEDFTPGLSNLLASPVDTFFYDGQWSWTPFVYYKVSAVDCNGRESDFTLMRPDDVTGTETEMTPEMTYLAQNFPNPFNPVTRIAFGLNKSESISLRVYDVTGHLVREVAKGELPEGRYEKVWDGRDASGVQVSSGIYFYRLDAGAFTQTKKMVLLR